MKRTKSLNILAITALASTVLSASAQAPSAEALINKLVSKGVLTDNEGKELLSEGTQTNQVSASKWKLSDAIKSIGLYGDVRLRYEYRGVDNVPGATSDTYERERFRYAVRLGIRGDLYDDFNYGLRVETSTNPRSPWATFGNNSTGGSVTPADKGQSGIGIGQVFLGWHPTDWYEMTVGRMPMPLYTTPMVWDSDINPEGAFEKFKYTINNVDLFADFGQFDYQDPTEANELPSSDTFVLAWQLGANVRIDKNMSFKIAPAFYNYTGVGTTGNGLNLPFVGQGNAAGANAGVPGATAANLAAYNQNGINDLQVLEIPAEYSINVNNTPLGPIQIRAFGDFAYNLSGDSRARAAYNANPAAFPGLSGAATGQDKAYQVGLGIGGGGPLYGPPKAWFTARFQRNTLGNCGLTGNISNNMRWM